MALLETRQPSEVFCEPLALVGQGSVEIPQRLGIGAPGQPRLSPEGICLGEVGLGGDGLAVFVNRLEQRALPMKSGGLVKGFLMLLSGLRRMHGYYENHNETGKGRRYVGKIGECQAGHLSIEGVHGGICSGRNVWSDSDMALEMEPEARLILRDPPREPLPLQPYFLGRGKPRGESPDM